MPQLQVDVQLAHLVSRLLVEDAGCRLSAEQALAHPFFAAETPLHWMLQSHSASSSLVPSGQLTRRHDKLHVEDTTLTQPPVPPHCQSSISAVATSKFSQCKGGGGDHSNADVGPIAHSAG